MRGIGRVERKVRVVRRVIGSASRQRRPSESRRCRGRLLARAGASRTMPSPGDSRTPSGTYRMRQPARRSFRQKSTSLYATGKEVSRPPMSSKAARRTSRSSRPRRERPAAAAHGCRSRGRAPAGGGSGAPRSPGHREASPRSGSCRPGRRVSTDGADLVVLRVPDHRLEPVVVEHLGVVVEEQHERRCGLRHGLVHRERVVERAARIRRTRTGGSEGSSLRKSRVAASSYALSSTVTSDLERLVCRPA